MGKLALLKAALAKGWLILVILMMINAAIAVYYYLCVVREAYFRDPGDLPAIKVDWATRTACVLLIGAIITLGVIPNGVMTRISDAIAKASLGAPAAAVVTKTAPSRTEPGRVVADAPLPTTVR